MRNGRGSLRYVCLKGYGDLVILVASICFFGRLDRGSYRLLLGTHLKDLYSELSFGAEVSYLNLSGEMPTMYSARTSGMLRALKSLAVVRSEIQSVAHPEESLFFDRLGLRERAIGLPRSLQTLPKGFDNVYFAYGSHFGIDQLVASDMFARHSRVGRGPIGVFPISRYRRKNMPESVVKATSESLADHGMRALVILLRGDVLPFEIGSYADVLVVDRSFNGLMGALRSLSAVVSVDSLPAHLSCYLGQPVFVMTPTDNQYYLPPSSYVKGFWARFDEFLRGPRRSWNEFLLHISGVVDQNCAGG